MACHVSRVVFFCSLSSSGKTKGLVSFFVSEVMDDETIIDSASPTDPGVQASQNKTKQYRITHISIKRLETTCHNNDLQCATAGCLQDEKMHRRRSLSAFSCDQTQLEQNTSGAIDTLLSIRHACGLKILGSSGHDFGEVLARHQAVCQQLVIRHHPSPLEGLT